MNLKYYYLYMQRCFGCPEEANAGLLTAHYAALRVDTAFDYHNMNQLLESGDYDVVGCRGYQAFTNPQAPSFIFFNRLQTANTDSFEMGSLANAQDTGWKFHILISDPPDSDNLERGWQLVKDELIRHQVTFAKIVNNSSRAALRDDNDQCSKVITVYAFKDNKTAQEWQQFIYDVSSKLREHNIAPAPTPTSDQAIHNSEYFSYRNDGAATEDPFADLDGGVNLRTSSISACCK